MKHLISCNQFNRENLEEIIEMAKEVKLNPKKYENSIDGKVVVTLFYEPSTRTRLSFETAVQRVGGKIVSTENAKEASSVVKGESLKDTTRTVHGYSDAIIIRHPDVDSSEIAASVSKVPIINARSRKRRASNTSTFRHLYNKRKKGSNRWT